jgi:hypothetical protein
MTGVESRRHSSAPSYGRGAVGYRQAHPSAELHEASSQLKRRSAFRSAPATACEGSGTSVDFLRRRRVERRPVLTPCARQRLAAVLPGRSGTGRGADSFFFRI